MSRLSDVAARVCDGEPLSPPDRALVLLALSTVERVVDALDDVEAEERLRQEDELGPDLDADAIWSALTPLRALVDPPVLTVRPAGVLL